MLNEQKRADASRTLASFAATALSWSQSGKRSYALLQLSSDGPLEAISGALPEARIDEPPLAVMAVRLSMAAARPAVFGALGGPGRPLGVVDAYLDGDGIIVEFDAQKTPLMLIVDTIDGELSNAPGRSIVPLVPLSDDNIAAFAAAALHAPQLDAARILERHIEPLLSREATG